MSSTSEKRKSKSRRKDKSSKKRSRSSIDEQQHKQKKESKISSSSSTSSSTSAKKSTSKRIKIDEITSPTKPSKTSTPSIDKSRVVIKQLDNPIIDYSSQQSLKVQVAPSSSSSDPIVVSFPSGLPSSMINQSTSMRSSTSRTVRFDDEINGGGGDTNNSSSPPVFTWTKAKKISSKGRIIHGSDDTCTYISSNEGRGTDGRHTKFYIGLYHKPTNTVQFIPTTEKGTVFAMNQSVTSYNDSKSLDFTNMSASERRRMVFETFGSQKKKKVLRSQQANIVEMKSVVGAGEGMMKALGKQMDGNLMSSSNVKVMEEMRDGSGGGGRNGKVCMVVRILLESIGINSIDYLSDNTFLISCNAPLGHVSN